MLVIRNSIVNYLIRYRRVLCTIDESDKVECHIRHIIYIVWVTNAPFGPEMITSLHQRISAHGVFILSRIKTQWRLLFCFFLHLIGADRVFLLMASSKVDKLQPYQKYQNCWKVYSARQFHIHPVTSTNPFIHMNKCLHFDFEEI